MSYSGSVGDRSGRASIGFISAFVNRTPSGCSPAASSTVGAFPHQVIRRAYPGITPRLVSSPPRHFRSRLDQHRSTGLYLLWFGVRPGFDQFPDVGGRVTVRMPALTGTTLVLPKGR